MPKKQNVHIPQEASSMAPSKPREYLESTDPDAFLDMEVKVNPNLMPKYGMKGNYELCPKCKGHGGWHLTLNSYGPGKHFNCWCADCNGWGWVRVGVELPTVKFARVKALFQDKLQHATNAYNTVGRRGGVYKLIDPSLKDHPDLHYALLLCADGWWPHNFGGDVKNLQYSGKPSLEYDVTVYTD